jgi:uncharacterized protein involved in cysteine biosynthesis
MNGAGMTTRFCPACGYPAPAEPCARCGGAIRVFGEGAPYAWRRRAPLFELLDGFLCVPFAALRLLHDRAFVGRLKLPILVNVVAFVVVLASLFFGSRALLLAAFGDGTAASWLAGIGSILAALLVTFLLGPVIVESAVSPFLDGLAEATERVHTGRPMSAANTGAWRGIVLGAKASARVLLVQLLLLAPLLLLAATGVGAIVAVLVSAWLCALVWFDVPCGRREYSLRDRRRLLLHNWARALGFGLAFQLGMLLPVFNLFLLTPTAAVAVSALYFRCAKPRALDSRSRDATVGPP